MLLGLRLGIIRYVVFCFDICAVLVILFGCFYVGYCLNVHMMCYLTSLPTTCYFNQS